MVWIALMALAPAPAPAQPATMDPFAGAFIRNEGQWNERALFRASGPAVDLWITADGMTYDFRRVTRGKKKDRWTTAPGRREGHVVKVSFVSPQPNLRATGVGKQAGEVRFRQGNALPRNREVRVEGAGPEMSARLYFDGTMPRYDLILKPGADVAQARLRYDGARNLRLGRDGVLRYDTALGTVEEKDLKVYQNVDGKQRVVPSTRRLNADGTVGFSVGAYDATKPLVIDPVVSTFYLGGDNETEGRSIATDPNGAIYFAGRSLASDLPTTTGPYTVGAEYLAYIARLNEGLLDWFGVLDNSELYALTADANRVVAVGKAGDGVPPVYAGGATPPTGWTTDGRFLLLEVSAAGDLNTARRFGNAVDVSEELTSVALAPNGDILVGAKTDGDSHPTTAGTVQPTAVSPQKGVVARLSTLGETLWMTYAAADVSGYVAAIDVDASGNVVIGGTARGSGLLNQGGSALIDATGYVAKLSANGTAVQWLGLIETQDGAVFGVDVSPTTGKVAVVSDVLPDVIFPKYRRLGGSATNLSGTSGGFYDVAILQLDSSGAMLWSDLAGGSGREYTWNVKIDANENVVGLFWTNSTDITVASGVPDFNGEAWVRSYNSSGAILDNFLVGGSDYDEAHAIALDPNVPGRAFLYGTTRSPDLPLAMNAPSMPPDGYDALLANIEYSDPGPVLEGLTFSGIPVVGNPGRKIVTTVWFDEPLTTSKQVTLQAQNWGGWVDTPTKTVPIGAESVNFDVYVDAVLSPTMVQLRATSPGAGVAGGSFLVQPPTVTEITISANTVSGGRSVTGTVKLGSPAPADGQVVRRRLVYVDGSPVPASVATLGSVNVLPGQSQANFTISTSSTNTDRTVYVETHGVRSDALNIVQPAVTTLTLSRASVKGGTATITGTVTLDTRAPAGGTTVILTTDAMSEVNLPVNVIVAAGSRTGSFTFTTNAVPTDTFANIIATGPATAKSQSILILAPRVKEIRFSKTSVAVGTRNFGRLVLDGPAPAAGMSFPVDTPAGLADLSSATVSVSGGIRTSSAFWIRPKAAGSIPVSSGTVTRSFTATP